MIVRLSNRIVTSPIAGKKLFQGLLAVIQSYESKYGLLDLESGLPATVETAPRETGKPPHNAVTATDKADLLLQFIRGLHVGYGTERSFKMYEKSLLKNRFLLSMSMASIPLESRENIISHCAQIGMPSHFMGGFRANMEVAKFIHFGFEEDGSSCTYKAYLEFSKGPERDADSEPNNPAPVLLYLGYKWDAFRNTRHALTKYVYHPLPTLESILQRVLKIYGSPTYPFQLVKSLISIASARIPPDQFSYLEVTEDNNPRISFDINMYRAGLQLAELYPLLSSMGQHYALSCEALHEFYDQAKESVFGHLSGGFDRQGKDFLTVYHRTERSRDQGTGPEGGLKSGVAPPGLESNRTPQAKRPDDEPWGRAGPEVGMLLETIRQLQVKIGIEYSFKILEGTLLTDRVLLGFKRDAIEHEPEEKVMDVCRRIGMPADFLELFRQNLGEATLFLFGFEGGVETHLKAYLEFGGRFEQVFRESPDRPKPFTIHLGFKWNVSDSSRKTIARYTCFPGLTGVDLMRRVSSGKFFSDKRSASLSMVENIVGLGGCRVNPGEFLYFEASEDDTERSSFDINMYRANLRVKELYAFLLEIGRCYSLPEGLYRKVYEKAKDYIFGHVSGGTDRQGRDFLTIYYGEKGSSRANIRR